MGRVPRDFLSDERLHNRTGRPERAAAPAVGKPRVRHRVDPVRQRAVHPAVAAAVPIPRTEGLPAHAAVALLDGQRYRACDQPLGRHLFPLCPKAFHRRRAVVPGQQRQHGHGRAESHGRELVRRAAGHRADLRSGPVLPADSLRSGATGRQAVFSGQSGRTGRRSRADARRHPGRIQPPDPPDHAEQRDALHLVGPQGEPDSEQPVLPAAHARKPLAELYPFLRFRNARLALLSLSRSEARYDRARAAQHRDFRARELQQRAFGPAESGSLSRRTGLHAFPR